MKTIFVLCVLFLACVTESFGQLVTKKDYNAAFALQVGGETGMLVPFGNPGLSLRPIGGLKMTFPFTRKWFLGSEINYSEFKYKGTYDADLYLSEDMHYRGDSEFRFDLKQVQVPVYLKYMLNCNKASVIFGFYGTYVFDAKLDAALKGGLLLPSAVSSEVASPAPDMTVDLSKALDKWNAGITVGYEHRIVKHLDVMLRVSAGLKEILKDKDTWGKSLFPVHACLTISYDIFRIGDCDCD